METQDRAPAARRKPTRPNSPDYALGAHGKYIVGEHCPSGTLSSHVESQIADERQKTVNSLPNSESDGLNGPVSLMMSQKIDPHSGNAADCPAKRVYTNSQTRYIFRTIRGPDDRLRLEQVPGAVPRTTGGVRKHLSVFCFAGGKHQCRLKKK